MQSVNKKRSHAGRRVSALVGALLLLVSVLIIPASAVQITDDGIVSDASFTVGSVEERSGYHWIENIFLSDVTIDDPYCYSWINVSPEFNSSVSWSYISFQFSMLNAPWQNMGHFTIGMYTINGSDVKVRIGNNYANQYPVDLPMTAGDIMLGYRVLQNPDGSGTYLIEMQCLVLQDDQIVQKETVYQNIPSEAVALSLELKTEYAAFTADGISNAEDWPHMPVDLAAVSNAFNDGFTEGEEYGDTWGYVRGWGSGAQSMFDSFEELYHEAGGPRQDLSVALVDREAILDYFRDLGWTDAVNQGSLTLKLVFGVLEAPLNVILGGMNFTLFGINLAQTIFAVLSIIIVFAIVRVVLAILPLV